MSELQLKDLYDGFRDPQTIKALKKLVDIEARITSYNVCYTKLLRI